MNKSKLKTLLLALSAVMMAIALILFPKESLQASLRGLNMWWEVVFPSLLPFFIISEMLIGFGVVRSVGVLLEPIMRPFFKVPGSGGFVMAMGMATGFPAGAKLTARLRQEKQISAIEAERLVSFTNSSNPLFIFGAVAVGFFQNAQLGVVLAASHYIGNVIVGLCMRFHGLRDRTEQTLTYREPTSFKHALRVLHYTRLNDNRPIGKLLGDAVTSSIQTLLMIGGFIILFSVFNQMLTLLHITDIIDYLLSFVFAIFQIPMDLSRPFISGLFEITLGSDLTSDVTTVTLISKATITSFILAFNGFSVQAQVASILADTDIRFKPFFFARILHGFTASVLTILLWVPLYEKQISKEATSPILPAFGTPFNSSSWNELHAWFTSIGPELTLLALYVYVFILCKRLLFSYRRT
ncbi:sporulation integral membrane protein YlbJ [Bacillus sp. HMF5848]|uniref:sporulation integral membrane protein YlbJ n=1 Tax=Bacillus sp. HMF5848 TaxID=2495421 RepID=UPI000F79CA5F|nr:sporulation integral membrane protein YlbJ [Bacillus sp. HMF5848]RSK26920.1 sporulation integral membrane protein YlbJ [Bacillus sp. HMF5848]